MHGGPTYDHEKVQFNLAKMRKGGEEFEIVVEPDEAVRYKEGDAIEVRDVIKAEKIFSDAKKGLLASEEHMKTVFGTTEPLKVAKKILDEGEVQLTAEHRQRIRDEKRNRIIERIRRNAIDPKTGSPHPLKRLELALEEAKVRIDETRRVEDQVKEVVQKLQAVLPIRLERSTFRIHLSAEYAQKLYGDVKGFGDIKRDEWLNDGSWACYLEIPAGLQDELFEMLNDKTHGGAEIEKVKE